MSSAHSQNKDDEIWWQAMLSSLAQLAGSIQAVSEFCQTRAPSLYQAAAPTLEKFRETNKEMIRKMETGPDFLAQVSAVKAELEKVNDVEETCSTLTGEVRFASAGFDFYRAGYPGK